MRYIILLLALSCAHHAPVMKTHKKYIRADWPHWSDKDNNCINTRHELLKSRSLLPVKMGKNGCNVVSGKWDDYYYPEIQTSAGNVDIDHLVPLKHAHDSGGAEWSLAEKEKFANDSENLVITYKVYNREKGPKTIAEWLPVNKEYACKYMRDWIAIKKKYQLKLGEREIYTLKTSGCPMLSF